MTTLHEVRGAALSVRTEQEAIDFIDWCRYSMDFTAAPAEGLKDAAQAVVDAWDAATDPRVNNRLSIKDYDFLHDEAVAALRAALKEPTDD
jgi:hypothetical protein